MTKECRTVDEVRKELAFGRLLSLCSPSITEFVELRKPTGVQEMATLIQDQLDGRQWKERKSGAGGYHSEKRYSDRKDDGRRHDQKREITRPTHSQQTNSNYYKSEFGGGPHQNHDGAQRRALVTCYLCKKKQWDCPERKVARVGAEACSSCQAK